jgi:hypothetical protein
MPLYHCLFFFSYYSLPENSILRWPSWCKEADKDSIRKGRGLASHCQQSSAPASLLNLQNLDLKKKGASAMVSRYSDGCMEEG